MPWCAWLTASRAAWRVSEGYLADRTGQCLPSLHLIYGNTHTGKGRAANPLVILCFQAFFFNLQYFTVHIFSCHSLLMLFNRPHFCSRDQCSLTQRPLFFYWSNAVFSSITSDYLPEQRIPPFISTFSCWFFFKILIATLMIQLIANHFIFGFCCIDSLDLVRTEHHWAYKTLNSDHVFFPPLAMFSPQLMYLFS